MCDERTASAFASLIWPRCKVCRSKFRVRLDFGIGLAANYLATLLLLGSLGVAVIRRDAGTFTLGFVAFIVLKVVLFHLGRLEPESRDPLTVMQLRRYAGRKDIVRPD